MDTLSKRQNHINKCLIIIDMQVGIFNLKQPVFNREVLIENINSLITYFRNQNFSIIFTQHENKSFLIKNSSNWAIIPELIKNDKDIIIYKSYPSIFEETMLEEKLNEINSKNLFICGLITNGCVQQACIDAFEKGYNVTLLSDSHSTFNKNPEKIITTYNNKLKEMGVKLTDTLSLLSQ